MPVEVATAIDVISKVGFPIAVAAFSLIKLDKTIKENTVALGEMSKAIVMIQTKNDN